MGIYKRGKVYWYKFQWQGKLIRESTKQSNDKVARHMEAAHRTSLAKGEVGLRDKKAAPTLAQFIATRFEPWAKSQFSSRVKTWLWYRNGMRRLKEFGPIALTAPERNHKRVNSCICSATPVGRSSPYRRLTESYKSCDVF